MLPSTKIAIGFIVATAGLYAAWNWWASYKLGPAAFKPIQPGRITLLGMRAGGPYRIIVQNRIAILQIVDEAEDKGFERPDDSASTAKEDSSEDVSGKRRVPIKELLGTLQGDEAALSRFITIMNDVSEADRPAVAVSWEAADVEKALMGDKILRAKLTSDLGVDLSGSPMSRMKISSLLNGIIVKAPVAVEVPVAGIKRLMTGYYEQPYRTAFAREIEKYLQEKQMRGDDRAALRAAIIEKAGALAGNPKARENVADSLGRVIDKRAAQTYAAPLRRVLGRAVIILNDQFLDAASISERVASDGKKYYTITLGLSEEGHKRLWQYSRANLGSQLLLVKDGVAIAAPVIRHELRDSSVDITQLQDPDLARETADLVNELKRERK